MAADPEAPNTGDRVTLSAEVDGIVSKTIQLSQPAADSLGGFKDLVFASAFLKMPRGSQSGSAGSHHDNVPTKTGIRLAPTSGNKGH